MAKKDTLFTVAGITTHRGSTDTGIVSERTKVRYGTDLIRLIKMLNNPKKIEDQTLGICLAPVRVDFVELPNGMIKADALKFLATHPQFQSAEDQATIAEEQSKREPKQPRAKKSREVKVKMTKAPKAAKSTVKATPSLDAIKLRSRKRSDATVDDVLAAVQKTTEVVATPEVAE